MAHDSQLHRLFCPLYVSEYESIEDQSHHPVSVPWALSVLTTSDDHNVLR